MDKKPHILYTRQIGDDKKKLIDPLVKWTEIKALEPVPIPVPEPPQPEEWAIVSSPNALTSIRKYMDKGWGAKAKWAVIGYRAAELLLGMGITPALRADNAGELVRVMPAKGKAVFLCGKDRTPTIEEYLDKSEWNYFALETYWTQPTYPHVNLRDFDVVAFFSPRNVESILRHNVWPEGVIAMAVGQTTAQALRDRGIQPLWVARRPDVLYMTQEFLEKLSHGTTK